MIFPNQFIVDNHPQEILFKNFSNGFSINLKRYTWSNIIFSWETQEMCLRDIQR